jgi:hypothetical protein
MAIELDPSGPLYAAITAVSTRALAAFRHGTDNAAMQHSATDAPGGGDGLVPVFVTNAVRTSAGPGPGVRRVPPDEAGRLVHSRLATYGDRPPRGFEDGGAPPAQANMVPQGG